MLERSPLRQWDPVPPPGTPGVTTTFCSLTCVRFSPIRPLVFAACSAEGFIYLFDLMTTVSGPVAILEALAISQDNGNKTNESTMDDNNKTGRSLKQQSNSNKSVGKRIGLTGIAFNRKQRDIIAACDSIGRVHSWRLNWRLSNKSQVEQQILDQIGNIMGEKDGE